MKTKLIFLAVFTFLFFACKKEPTPVIEQPLDLSMDSMAADTSKILVAALPAYFDSTQVLIHCIGFQDVREKSLMESKVYSKSRDSDYGFWYTTNHDHFSGNIVNLYFDNTEANEQLLLTDKALNISNIYYQRALAKKTGRHYLTYQVYDKDYNGDGKLNGDDIPSLYVSTLDGKYFTKVTRDFHAYLDGAMILMNLRYYFRTYEDVNRNCRFDKKIDKYHYYYIDFSVNPYKVVEYNPMGTVYGNTE